MFGVFVNRQGIDVAAQGDMFALSLRVENRDCAGVCTGAPFDVELIQLLAYQPGSFLFLPAKFGVRV